MAINIRFTAQEQEVIKALKAMGGETAKLVEENIKLANQFARTDAESKFFARGLDRLGQSERDFAAASFKASEARRKEAEKTAAAIERAAERERRAIQRTIDVEAKQANSRREAIANGIASAVGFQFGGPAAGIGGAIGGLQGAAIGGSIDGLVALGQEVSKTTEKYNRLQMALDTATGSAASGAKAFSFIVDIARQTGLRIDDLADSYKGFAAASRGTKLEGKETERIFTSIVKAGAAMMLSNEQVKGSLLAVSQMMSKGNVQAEELRGQLSERLPGAFNILASEMGVTTAQLNDLLKAGAVLSEDALPKLANGLDKISKDQYKKNLDTITGAMNNLKNEVDLVVVSFGRQSNINGFFASLINGFASVVRSGGFTSFVEGMMNAMPVLGMAYTGYKASGAIKASSEPYRKITKSEAIKDASELSLTEQKKRLDAEYKRMKFLDKAVDPNSNIAANSEQLKNYQREHDAIKANYTLRKQAYEGEAIQRATAKKAAEDKLGLSKKELTQLKDINKEIDKSRTLLNDLSKKDPTGFTKSKDGIALMEKIGKLNEEKAKLEAFGKLGKPPKGGSKESAFAKQIHEENEAGKDLFKERLEIIKQARLDAERLANTPTAFSSSPIDSVMPLFGGKKVADIQTGFGNEMLQSGKIRERFAEMLKTSLSNLTINPDEIYIDPTITLKEATIEKAKSNIESYFSDLGGIWEENAGQFADIVAGGITNALQSGFSGLGNAIATGENPFKALGQGIVGAFGDMLIQVGQLMLAQAGALLAASILSGGALGAEFAKALAGGAALTTAGSAMKAVKFADGGIVSGRTFAEVGEYRGARNNPEVIAPLNKLGTIFTPFFQRAVSMGRVNQPKLAMQPVTTTTNVYMDGKVLLQQLDRTILRQGRI